MVAGRSKQAGHVAESYESRLAQEITVFISIGKKCRCIYARNFDEFFHLDDVLFLVNLFEMENAWCHMLPEFGCFRVKDEHNERNLKQPMRKANLVEWRWWKFGITLELSRVSE